jgi:hypothetical protein
MDRTVEMLKEIHMIRTVDQRHALRSGKYDPGSNGHALLCRADSDQHFQSDNLFFRQFDPFGRCSHLSSPEMKFIKIIS